MDQYTSSSRFGEIPVDRHIVVQHLRRAHGDEKMVMKYDNRTVCCCLLAAALVLVVCLAKNFRFCVFFYS